MAQLKIPEPPRKIALDRFLEKLEYVLQAKHRRSAVTFEPDRIIFHTQSQNKELLQRICAEKGFIMETEKKEPYWYNDTSYRKEYKEDVYRISVPTNIPLMVVPQAEGKELNLLKFLETWNAVAAPCGWKVGETSVHHIDGWHKWLETKGSNMEKEYLSSFGFEFSGSHLVQVNNVDWQKAALHEPGDEEYGLMYFSQSASQYGFAVDACGEWITDLDQYELGDTYEKLPNTTAKNKYEESWFHFLMMMRPSLIIGDMRVTKKRSLSGFSFEKMSAWDYTLVHLKEAVARSDEARHQWKYDPVKWLHANCLFEGGR